MISFSKNTRILLAALALGGAALAGAGDASARPIGHGGHHGGYHGGHHGGGHHGGGCYPGAAGGWYGPGCHGGGHGGHRPHWGGGGYGPVVGGLGLRCRLVERENRYGEIVVRRVCFSDPRV